MKLSIYTTAFILAASITSCSLYQNTQMPDDLYFTKGPEANEYLAFNDNGSSYNSEDNYLRMKVRNRNRWSSFDEFDAFGAYPGYYGGWGGGMGMGMGFYPSFGFGGMGMGMGWNNPWMWGSGLRMGWGFGGWNNPWMDPFWGGGWGHGGMGMGYFGGFGGFPGFFPGYPIGYYPGGGKGGAIANKPTRTFNSGQYSRTGAYNNRNTFQNTRNTNSFGSSLRNVFTPGTVNPRVNSNYMGTSTSRPTRTYNNENSSFPTRTMSNSSSMGSSRGGSSGGSSGGGGGISRPGRN